MKWREVSGSKALVPDHPNDASEFDGIARHACCSRLLPQFRQLLGLLQLGFQNALRRAFAHLSNILCVADQCDNCLLWFVTIASVLPCASYSRISP